MSEEIRYYTEVEADLKNLLPLIRTAPAGSNYEIVTCPNCGKEKLLAIPHSFKCQGCGKVVCMNDRGDFWIKED